MIRHITGTIIERQEDAITIDIGGLGYLVNIGKRVSGKENDTVSLWVHMAVREHSNELFGFGEKEELALFEYLIAVSGIGPRSALSIMDLAPVSTLYSAIINGETEYLTKVSGIGKKTAEKIVFELRDKIDAGLIDIESIPNGDADVLEALVSLGYSREDARKAVKNIDIESTELNDRLSAALKVIQ